MINLINLYSGLAQCYIVASHVIVSLEALGSILAFVPIILYLDFAQSGWSPCRVCGVHVESVESMWSLWSPCGV